MKYVLFAALAVALLLFGCTGSSTQAPPAAPPQAGSGQPPAPPIQEAASSTGAAGITPAVLAQHNKESDCWFSYKGKVYDTTDLIPNHKNYKDLLVPLCGTSSEFEAAFEGKHGTSKVEVLINNSVYKGELVAQG